MIKETMTAAERMDAAVKLQPLDRIPCAPLVDVLFPARYKGVKTSEAIRNMKVGFQGITDVYEESGGWDGMILPGYSLPMTPHVHSGIVVTKNTVNPGAEADDDAVPQFQETAVLTLDDYDDIISLGWKGFRLKHKDRFNPLPEEKIIKWTERQMAQYRLELAHWRSKAVIVAFLRK